MARKYIDCRELPSELNCTVSIFGTEDEVLELALFHAVNGHGHKETHALREQLRSMLKDEAGATLPRLTEYRQHGQLLRGVFTGKHGPTFLDDLARGAVGNMPAAGFADLYVMAWQDWTSGKRDEAMEVFGKTLLLIADAQAYGVAGQKYILQLRGVFPNSKCRGEAVALDDEAKEAIRRTVAYTQRWF